ncbi:TPA: hypothetical protein HA265_04645 [Candidatus Woesearchaeota archaeon]|nr:hypothetical protein [Candidatus Woesearchaeota archaeon]
MIARPDWFERRKYGGWGVHPKTWQGWVYIAMMILPFIIFQALPYWTNQMRTLVTVVWLGFLLFDLGHVMITLKKDERERKLEALSDRNAAWVMLAVLVTGLLYQGISSALAQQPKVDWFLAAALIGGALAKTISEVYLAKRSL